MYKKLVRISYHYFSFGYFHFILVPLLFSSVNATPDVTYLVESNMIFDLLRSIERLSIVPDKAVVSEVL